MQKSDITYSRLSLYYDSLFAAWGKDYEKESQLIHSIIQQNKLIPGKVLLDLGCGTGEHLLYLQKYYDVTGLDCSNEMITIASKKVPNANFYEMDMSNFQIEKQFDIVICLFSAIGYVRTLPRLHSTISSISNHLNSGGIVIIEPWFTPDDFEKHRYDSLYGEKGNFKACRMRKSTVREKIAYIDEHILISNEDGVLHFTSKHKFGLFNQNEIIKTLELNKIIPSYSEPGLSGRGIYIGIKK